TTTTSRAPPAARARSAAFTSGSSQGSRELPLRLWYATCQLVRPSCSATARAEAVISATYGERSAIATGTLCAVKTSGAAARRTAGSVTSAAVTASATAVTNRGCVCQEPTQRTSGARAPSAARAASTSSV